MNNEIKRTCINCKYWRIAIQNIFVTTGCCDIGYGSTFTSPNFSCGKFELTPALQEQIKENKDKC